MTFPAQLTSGLYLPGSSPLHRLDPRAKLATCVLAMAAVFWPGGSGVSAWPLAALAVALSGVSLGALARVFRPFVWLFALTLAVHSFTTHGQSLWPFPLGPIDATREGILRGALVAAQLATGIGYSTLLTLTTSPEDLIWAIERLASPLDRLRLPVAGFCLTLLVALHVLPILWEEVERLKAVRRDAPGEAGFRSRLQALSSTLARLLRQVLARAELLARGLQAGRSGVQGRAPDPRGRFGAAELIAVGLGIATLAASLGIGG